MTTCVVSAYYKIPSRRTHQDYVPFITRFFNSVKSVPVVFFTTQDVVDEIRKITNTDHVTFVYLPFEELQAFKKFGIEFWVRQMDRNPEKYHSYQLGAVWYEKKEFVLRAMDMVRADVYIWCDAGCIRDQLSEEHAKSFGTRKIYSTNDNRIHLQQVWHNVTSKFYRYPHVCIAGAIAAGTSQAWEEFSQLYDIVLRQYDSNEVPAIMDQYITKSCVDSRPGLFVLYPQPSQVDCWFKFLEFL